MPRGLCHGWTRSWIWAVPVTFPSSAASVPCSPEAPKDRDPLLDLICPQEQAAPPWTESSHQPEQLQPLADSPPGGPREASAERRGAGAWEWEVGSPSRAVFMDTSPSPQMGAHVVVPLSVWPSKPPGGPPRLPAGSTGFPGLQECRATRRQEPGSPHTQNRAPSQCRLPSCGFPNAPCGWHPGAWW